MGHASSEPDWKTCPRYPGITVRMSPVRAHRPMRFDMICEANGIEHRLTKPNHPWSSKDQEKVWGTFSPRDGQVERMNRTIKDATIKTGKPWQIQPGE